MRILPLAIRALAAATVLALCCLPVLAQQLPAGPAAATPATQAAVASLNDSLMARATALYNSTIKTGLHGFDCQVHPDWMKIIVSSRNGALQDSDTARAALLGAVKIVLHARIKGGSTLDWQPPDSVVPRTQATVDMLDRAHRSIESTLEGVLKLWTPLVDGSLAESLGEDEVATEATGGYAVRSKNSMPNSAPNTAPDKQKPPIQSQDQSVTEEFDHNLLLKHFTLIDAGSTASLTPVFQPTPRGLLVSSFDALLQPAGIAAAEAREMHIAFDYQPVSGIQIPGKIGVELPGVVEMNFALDGCALSPPD